MMKAPPITSFVMAEADLLLEFPVVTLNAPAHFDDVHQFLDRNIGRQGGQEVAGWFNFTGGPFDQQPFFLAGPVGLCGAYAHPREA